MADAEARFLHPPPYKVCLGCYPVKYVQTYKEVWALIGNAPFGTTRMVYDANGKLVDEFIQL